MRDGAELDMKLLASRGDHLGLDITTWRYPGALFTSAGGYHHHVGLNVWVANSPPASMTDSRLLFWEILLPDSCEVQRAAESLLGVGYPPLPHGDGLHFKDPWGITVALRVAGQTIDDSSYSLGL